MKKRMEKIMVFGVLFVVMSLNAFAGNFVIQNSTGTDLFTVDVAGNANVTGDLRVGGELLTALFAPYSLASAHVFVGSAGGAATDVAMTGDVSITNAGVTDISGSVAKDLVGTSPMTINGGTNVDNIIYGADADVTVALTLLKDIVTTAPLTGAVDDVLPGADSDVTLALTLTGDLVTTAPIAGAAADIFPGDGTKATISLTACSDTEIYKYNSTSGAFECEADATGTGGNSTEEMQDAVWAAVGGDGTETHIAVTYQDATNDVDFVVSDDWYDALTDMTLADNTIYVGDGSNNPVGVAMSGDIAIVNTGATTIQADAVEESMLKVTGAAAVDEDIFTYEATTGDFEWHTPAELGMITDVVEDTTPQLGGNLDLNTHNIGRASLATNMTIDASGNFIITLG